MCRLLLLLVAFILLSVPGSTSALVPAQSIAPLQNAEGKNICTASSINQREHYWLTARHCVMTALAVDEDTSIDIPTMPFMAGEPVTLVMESEDDDLAVITSSVSAPALHIAAVSPKLGDRITLYGYAFGLQKPFLFQGYVACTDCDLDREHDSKDPQTHYMMFDMSAAGGDSGSPVFSRGHVISVLQIGMSMGSSATSGGVRYWELVKSTISYWER